MQDQFKRLSENLQALGHRRLSVLGGIVLLTLGLLALIGWWASQPAFVTLYSGLGRDDVNRIGPVLSSASISYDVDSGGTAVLVRPADASRARMILAENGLPRSSGSGYELFDTMGSLGLTSFMQQVTRVRALEGEIARSIRMVEGVRSARVHIVLPDQSSFSRRGRTASASVLLQTDSRMNTERAEAIRHLVAAAVPGLGSEAVTVLGATGHLLASGKNPSASSLTGGLAIQRLVEGRLAENIRRMLHAWLGAGNYQVSVKAVVDTSERRVEETIFDPDSRVERSVQVVRLEENDQQNNGSTPVSVAQDIPEEEGTTESAGNASQRAMNRREETTNYEINSKRVATVNKGYSVTRLSAAIVLNRTRLDTLAGGAISQQDLEARLASVRRSVLAAAGFDEERGDVVDVDAIAFADKTDAGAISPGEGIVTTIAMQTGGVVRAVAFLAAIAIVVLGLRSTVRMILVPSSQSAAIDAHPVAIENAKSQPRLESASGAEGDSPAALNTSPAEEPALPVADRSAQERLQALVDLDEARAAEVLRGWLSGEHQRAEAA